MVMNLSVVKTVRRSFLQGYYGSADRRSTYEAENCTEYGHWKIGCFQSIKRDSMYFEYYLKAIVVRLLSEI